ncbi:amidase signature domain-containing protein [Dichotomopilus funicola]|uniref:Amidase signature domain-containing protein n=1 Tax=Dichotomopilus funicola TaxID=1934379 RepID=A0AAN6V674_9PEZI|nr:amidase signature domain-containing protein [Dichotomopilus funicola]
MAISKQRFANHPGAKEAPASSLEYHVEEDQNPALRGRPLALASIIIERLPLVQKLLWNNAKFGQAQYIPDLDGVPWRIQPDVIPLADSPFSSSTSNMLPIGPELSQPQPEDLGGRFYSAADYHAMYASGAVTPLQVAEALLGKVDLVYRPKSKYSAAWTQTKAMDVLEAARASTERWKNGSPLSILDGVPFGVKDDIAVKGFVSRMGMKVDRSEEYFNKVKEESAWPVRALEEAGAIMLGKMNQHEVGMDTTGCNPSTGTAVNWYNTSYYPGGSSSGAGSALSAGLIPIALGTDAGGSMRIPPAFCGVYGIKTTHNRTCHVSSSVCVVGPMAATAADLTIAYRFASQPNPDDPVQSLLAISTTPDAGRKKYVGVCRAWTDIAEPDVIRIFDESLAHLVSAGYEVVDIQLPFLREGQLAHSAICLAEAAADARGRANDPGRYLGLLNHPNRVVVATGSHTPAVDFLKYGQLRTVIMQHVAHLFAKYPGLLILTPTTPIAGWPITEGDQAYGCFDGNMSIRNMSFAWVANMTGCPAVTFPAGYVDPQQGEGKLPVGLMAMGEWGAEEQLLGFAREREAYLNEVYPGGRLKPEEWFDTLGAAQKAAEVGRHIREKTKGKAGKGVKGGSIGSSEDE